MKSSHKFQAIARRIGIFVVLALIGAAVFALLGETNSTSAQDANRADLSKVSIPLAKCQGSRACQGINQSLVADGSCNGTNACRDAKGPIGAGSCNGTTACRDAKGPIGAGSCNGTTACQSAAGEIGASSCNGVSACQSAAGEIGAGSCNNASACLTAAGPIGAGSCNNSFVCSSTAGAIGAGSCNVFNACRGAAGPIGAGSCNSGFSACSSATGAIGAGSCNGTQACESATGAIGNNSCNTTGTACRAGATFPVGDCQRNDVLPAACPLPPQPTTLPPQPLPPPEQPKALDLSVVAFAPAVTVVPTGAATRDTKTYDVVFTIQNVSRIAAPAVLAHLTIPQELKVTSVAWEKEGQFYIDGDLPRKCSFDGLSAYCGIGQLWSGMKASVKLRVTADPGTYTFAIAAQDLSNISEVSNNNQSKSLSLTLP